MKKIYNMSEGTAIKINAKDYSEDEFLIAEIEISITEDVFKQCASTVLGKFLVAKVIYGDASGHASDEVIVGYIPTEQEVRFVRNSQGYLRGIVDGVISKQYAPEFCEIFTKANHTRSVSVEMGVEEEPCNNAIIAKRFNIVGITVLGMSVRPSSPGSTIDIKRFSETMIKNDCDKYYKSVWQRLAEREYSELDVYIQNRKSRFAKSYSANTTELKETPWGEVDKVELRNKVMEASNRDELVKKVYLKVLDGWEEAPSENLKYPVMEFKDGTFYYNRFALASALAYAKQHNEADIVSQIEKLYKKFNLAEEGEEKNMSKNFEIEGREAWGDIIAQVKEHEGDSAYVDSVEDDYIIFTIDDVRYRVEADIQVGEDDKTVKAVIDWDSKKKDEVQDEDDDDKEEKSEDEHKEDDIDEEADSDEDKMSDEAQKKIGELEDIIMQKDKEIAELKEYKDAKEKAEKEFAVQSLLEELRECVDDETLEKLKEEGLACNLADIDGWKNKAKAMAFDKGIKKEMSASIWSMDIPNVIKNESTSKWDSI